MQEIYKIIPNNEDYVVSNLGNIISLERKIWNGKGFLTKKEKQLKPHKTKKGYLHIELYGKAYAVHRLVAQAFIPNPNNLPQVNHIKH